ncbi:hypothetical protein BDW75DRAFT_243726 [Aspergillus navahoensis]
MEPEPELYTDLQHSALSGNDYPAPCPMESRAKEAVQKDDVEALNRELIPQILTCPAPRVSLRRILHHAIAGGHWKGFVPLFDAFVHQREEFYEFIESNAGPEERAFQLGDLVVKARNEEFESEFTSLFIHAIKNGNRRVVMHMIAYVQDARYGLLLDRVYNSTPGSTRTEALVRLMFACCEYDDQIGAREILKENFEFLSVARMLNYVRRRRLVAFIPMILDNLLLPNKGGLAQVEDVVRPDYSIGPSVMTRSVEARCMLTIQRPLAESIEDQWDAGTNLLLGPYIHCLAKVDWGKSHDYDANVLNSATDTHLANALTRAQAIDYLDVHLPPAAQRAMFRRLALPDGEIIKMTTCGMRFSAHRDILCYWSRYFQGLSRHNWADNEWVDFRNDIDPAAMRAVINFMYTGTYRYQGDPAGRYSFLIYLRTIADYFLIDRLTKHLDLMLTRLQMLGRYTSAGG